jgi:hypothetical protein
MSDPSTNGHVHHTAAELPPQSDHTERTELTPVELALVELHRSFAEVEWCIRRMQAMRVLYDTAAVHSVRPPAAGALPTSVQVLLIGYYLDMLPEYMAAVRRAEAKLAGAVKPGA